MGCEAVLLARRRCDRPRFLSPAELARLGKVLASAAALGVESQFALAAIRLPMLSGCRKNEILTLKRTDVDHYHRCLRLRDSKTGSKIVHLGAAAMRVVREISFIVGNPYLLQLVRELTAIEGSDGANVLMVGMTLAQALMVEGKHAATVAQANAVYPCMLARLGADHEMTLQLLTTRAQSEGILERWSDAICDDLHVHDIAVRKQGPKSSSRWRPYPMLPPRSAGAGN